MGSIAVAWLLEKDWTRWRQIDPTSIPETHAQWLENINRRIAMAETGDVRAVKINIDPDIFLRWCAKHGMTPGVKSRIQYAGRILIERSERAA